MGEYFQPDVARYVFNDSYVVQLANRDSETTASFLKGLVDLSKFAVDAKRHPYALEVLEAFDLGSLVTPSFEEQLRRAFATLHSTQEPLSTLLRELRVKYERMVACERALDLLTTPEILRQPDIIERIISVEIHYRPDRLISALDLSETIATLQNLYAAVATIAGTQTEGRLLIVKVESGSSIKIEFDGIFSEPVKMFKDLLLEFWTTYRHRKVEDLIQKNRAAESSLGIIDLIRNNASLPPEQKQKLMDTVFKDTLDLYKGGVLPVGLPREEDVDNVKLLEQFSPRLLEGPAIDGETKDSETEP
jgi:hypothetical protein